MVFCAGARHGCMPRRRQPAIAGVMDPLVFAAVLVAAACHAGWNAAVKKGLDPLATTVAITVGSSVVAALLVPFVGLPPARAWPWVVASVLIHVVYFAALIESYRAGDMGQVYPIARGSAPLLTAGASAALIGETIGLAAWIGIVLLAGGVLLLSLRGGRDLARIDRRAVGFALFTALTICVYSLVDGTGARVSGDAHSYTAAMFLGNGIAVAAYGLFRRGPAAFGGLARHWPIGLFGGTLSLVSYGIVIWAMTVAPIAIVAALRETSVLFATLIAVVVLREPLRAVRLVAAVVIVIGVALIRLQP
jgi:drug/metabolite transporter (DMT)-like permease